MTQDKFDKMIAHLRALGNCEIEPRNSSQGVCVELYWLFGVSLVSMVGRIKYWPERNGSPSAVPIEGDNDGYEDNLDNRHAAEYGAKRRRLCLWLADNFTMEDFA